jgi:hypothetical protein
MATANERYHDAQLKHAVDVRRFTAGEVNDLMRALEKADARLIAEIRRRPAKDFTKVRLRALLEDVRELRKAAMRQFRASLTPDLRQLGKPSSPVSAPRGSRRPFTARRSRAASSGAGIARSSRPTAASSRT